MSSKTRKNFQIWQGYWMDSWRKPLIASHGARGQCLLLIHRGRFGKKRITKVEGGLKTLPEGSTKLTLTGSNGLREYWFVHLSRGHDH